MKTIRLTVVTIAVVALAIAITFAQSVSRGRAEVASEESLAPHLHEHQPRLAYDTGTAAVWQDLERLGTIASALHVTAHPDDEDGGMLTFESRGRGARMALLTLTRGEGGQNLMSADFFDALGILRTEEQLAADRYYGVEQMFTPAIDYGFSKTADEARQKWGEDRVVGAVVLAIREFRPLVVIARFQGTPRDGHGHHQMSGIAAREAFAAAGDPTKYPEQLRDGLRPWTPLKLYMDNVHSNETWNVVIHSGDYKPTLGDTYADISRRGWWNHRTQFGGGYYAHTGVYDSYYKRLAPDGEGADKEKSFFSGINVGITGMAQFWNSNAAAENSPGASRIHSPAGAAPAWLTAGLEAIARNVQQAQRQFSAAGGNGHPEALAPVLARGLGMTRALRRRVEDAANRPAGADEVARELDLKIRQYEDAIADALGVEMYAYVAPEQQPTGFFARFVWQDTPRVVIPNEKFNVKIELTSRSPLPVAVKSVGLRASDAAWQLPADQTGGRVQEDQAAGAGQRAQELAGDHAETWRFELQTPAAPVLTRPYWHPRDSVEHSWYDLDRPQYELRPLAPYPLSAVAELTVNGLPVKIRRRVLTTEHVKGVGQQFVPLMTAPAISVTLAPRAGIVPLATQTVALTATVHSNVEGGAKGSVALDLPAGWTSEPANAAFDVEKQGEDATLDFTIHAAARDGARYRIGAVADWNGQQFREGYREVGYMGITPYPLYRPAAYRTTGVQVQVAPGLRIGYIMGTGDSVPAAMRVLGVTPHPITPGELASADLSQYDEIMLGVRAYVARDDVKRYNGRLLDYVRNGGVLVVQYNTFEFDHDYGPYPYKMGSGQEVTDETAAVEILDPRNPVLSFPNRITEADFDGWVEQRGSRFFDSWAPEYEALLSSHDPGQAPQRGGLLFARYGRGIYVLQSYALYRQLPEGVPGSYRLLANLLSLPKSSAR
jgi:LmbE family N-acetylglucosaminyl deacetylase